MREREKEREREREREKEREREQRKRGRFVEFNLVGNQLRLINPQKTLSVLFM